ncbi:Metalloenzyme, LuxS/M16 peptidase-like protein [Chytridium lagenaria]|nr:Metalloenzyme, LuxS/M16 peptidase-like protein [Chytridium lagenaria]
MASTIACTRKMQEAARIASSTAQSKALVTTTRRLISNLNIKVSPTSNITSRKASSSTFDIHMPDTRVTKLPNGFTVASETNPNFQTATVGVWIDAGSRFENEKNNGTAHFLEHMAFKGTKTRSQLDLEVQIENMGAHLNAYTSREQTVYYAKSLSADLPKAVDILADILQRSKYNPDAIERERDVILRESEEVDKQKEEVVFDHLHATAYQTSALGRTILGPAQNIKSITRQDLIQYVERNYQPDRMVLAAAGGVDHESLVKLADKHFGHLKTITPDKEKDVAIYGRPKFVGSEVRANVPDHPTAHLALAVEGVSWTSPDYWPLLVAQSVVGSWDRSLGATPNVSSGLAQSLYRFGLANSFMSFNTSYSDTGLFGIYAVTEADVNLGDTVKCIQEEWHRLATSATEQEVQRAKNQLKTSLLLSLDGTTPVAEDIGRQLLVYGRRMNPVEIEGLIESVTAQQVMEAASKYLKNREVCVVGYGPLSTLPAHPVIQKGMKL